MMISKTGALGHHTAPPLVGGALRLRRGYHHWYTDLSHGASLMNPKDLSTKIITRIWADRGSTYDRLEARAVAKAIPMSTFEAAMAIVHRSKLIEQSVKYGVIQYRAATKSPIKEVVGAAWVTQNYPWPEKFVMPFPEIDMSHLFLKGEDLERYKCESKGRQYIPGKRKAYEYARG